MKQVHTAVLALAPVYRGLGYVVFDHERELLDWGVMEARRNKNAVCLEKARLLLQLFAPKSVALELIGARSCRRRQRIRELISDLALLAEEGGHQLAFCDRSTVVTCLGLSHGATKDEIASAIACAIPPLAHRLPKPRQIWESEKHSMAIFTAAALGIAHFSTTAFAQ